MVRHHRLYRAILTASLGLCVSHAVLADTRGKSSTTLEYIEVSAEHLSPFSEALGLGKIYTGKKISVVEMAEQPAIVEPNLRRMFSTLPGLFVSEQKIPSIYNINYRGLGNPHESEFVAFFQNGVPLASDWFGYPTIYYLPPAQRVERIEFIRGGSSLLNGPQIGPSINFVLRRPEPGSDSHLRTDHALGSDGLYSTYNEAAWSDANSALMIGFDHRRADGARINEDYRVNAGYLGFTFDGFDNTRLGVDVDVYQSDSGEAGRLSSDEFAHDRYLTKTPFNRVEIDRHILSLNLDHQWNSMTTLHGKAWYSSQDRFSRRSASFIDPADQPDVTNLDQQVFDTLGMDVRMVRHWGGDDITTLGTTLYDSDSPRTRHVGRQLTSNQQKNEDLLYQQARQMSYHALFAEHLFNVGDWRLVPTVRYESIHYDLEERVKNPGLQRDRIDLDTSASQWLWGLGIQYDASAFAQWYGNVSKSYRPQRFDDLINPSSELSLTNAPNVSTGHNVEFGWRYQGATGLALDMSVFTIDFSDKVEQIQVNEIDIERVNSGDSRHRGVEMAIQYRMDVDRERQLTLFANGSWLDATIRRSVNQALIGNTPAFAPQYLLRSGVMYDDGRLHASLTATIVDEQYWQDNHQSRGAGNQRIEAKIPAYEVVDASVEWALDEHWQFYGGINNVFDQNYYSRVRNDGIEPAHARTFFVGLRWTR
ncbi:MAG TPA: TonB-dependent receptor [Pseudomonadales bacterium]|nr:TonB-dependent receptor [Pseudomonadales bacterium]